MPPQTHGNITILVLLLTFTLNALFGILIARACWRAYSRKDTDEYLRVVFLNDSLERIRDGVLREAISWSTI